MTLITYPSVSADNSLKIARHQVLELSQLGQSLKKNNTLLLHWKSPRFWRLWSERFNSSTFVVVVVFGTRFRPANQLAIDSIAIQISADTTNRFVIWPYRINEFPVAAADAANASNNQASSQSPLTCQANCYRLPELAYKTPGTSAYDDIRNTRYKRLWRHQKLTLITHIHVYYSRGTRIYTSSYFLISTVRCGAVV